MEVGDGREGKERKGKEGSCFYHVGCSGIQFGRDILRVTLAYV